MNEKEIKEKKNIKIRGIHKLTPEQREIAHKVVKALHFDTETYWFEFLAFRGIIWKSKTDYNSELKTGISHAVGVIIPDRVKSEVILYIDNEIFEVLPVDVNLDNVFK